MYEEIYSRVCMNIIPFLSNETFQMPVENKCTFWPKNGGGGKRPSTQICLSGERKGGGHICCHKILKNQIPVAVNAHFVPKPGGQIDHLGEYPPLKCKQTKL